MKLHNSEVIFFVTTKISWNQNLKTASTGSSITPILNILLSPKGKKVAVKKAASKQGKIYVGKFKDASITEDQIREYFTQYGQVVEIQRPVDRSKNRWSIVLIR